MATTEEDVLYSNRQGIALAQQGRLEDAAVWFQRALQLQPHSAAAHNNLGNILYLQGRYAEAVPCYRTALQLLPDDPATLNNLGNVLRHTGELEESVACGRRAVLLQPNYSAAHSNLGLACEARGELNEALYHCQMAVHLQPDFAEGYNNLSIVLRGLRRFDESLQAGREALRLRPDFAEAHNNLGFVLQQQERYRDSEDYFRAALKIRPDFTEAKVNLASSCWSQDRLDEAVALCKEALAAKPNFASAHNIVGAVHLKRGEFAEALDGFDRAVKLEPDLAEAHLNRAMVLLHLGKFAEGWREYAWRWKCKHYVVQPASRPYWDGTSLAGRSILLAAEQGLGDTLQFIRYARLVKEQGATVVVACQRPLLPLLSRCSGIDQLLPQDGVLPECDTHLPLLSLPGIFDTVLETIPSEIPYLFADEQLVEHWRRELTAFAGFKVGIAWKGNSSHPFDRYRSIPLAQFAPLAMKGVTLLSLQKGQGSEQIETVANRFAVVDLGRRLDEASGAFMDTAAVMKNLDLVITTDTAIAHLAGGLGVPVWVALPYVPDWRWLLDRDDTPWYPTMKLFRQSTPENWEQVFAPIASELARLAGPSNRRISIPIEVSPGELIDKIGILQIKLERINDPVKRNNVATELAMLTAARDRVLQSSPGLDVLTMELKKANSDLWESEDAIRGCEQARDFGPRFIELARSIYRHNDRRGDLKRQINELLGSKLMEEKSYRDS